jgi:hypothetical protein
MNRSFLFPILHAISLCFSINGISQNYFYNSNYFEPRILWETGLSAGGMNCLTDLGGKKGAGSYFIKDLNVKNTRFCASAYVHALYNNFLGGRIEIIAGQVTAYDSILKEDNSVARYRYKRNLHFRSLIAELSFIGEWYFLSHLIQQNLNREPLLSPYFLAGAGVFHFNPEAKLNNDWVLLQPLHTEGQGFREYPERKKYSRTQVNFPVGMGVRFELSALLNVQMEVVHRILMTDYLDDVSTNYIDPTLFNQYLDISKAVRANKLYDRRRELNPAMVPAAGQQRGDPSDKDAYFSVNLKIGLVLNRQRR